MISVLQTRRKWAGERVPRIDVFLRVRVASLQYRDLWSTDAACGFFFLSYFFSFLIRLLRVTDFMEERKCLLENIGPDLQTMYDSTGLEVRFTV